jgi:ribosome biogenesis GTPase
MSAPLDDVETKWDPALWGWRRTGRTESVAPESLARVVRTSHGLHTLVSARGEITARVARRIAPTDPMPAVGDWVTIERGLDPAILAVLPRFSALQRKEAGGRTASQVIATNIDSVFIVMGMDGDFNPARLERFVVMVSASGAQPVVVLTKADLAADVADLRLGAMGAAPGQPVLAVSAVDGQGLAPLRFYLQPGQTVALVGSSGAGKSTLLNTLVGEPVMATAAVRGDDDRGRHTTTHRELVRLPGGAMLIDNPGVREVQLWAEDVSAIDDAFADIARIAERCRFRDCSHSTEPGCAVLAAVESGELGQQRLEHMHGLERELRSLRIRRDEVERRRESRRQGRVYRQAQKAHRKTRGDRR